MAVVPGYDLTLSAEEQLRPRAASTSTPTQHENDRFILAVANGTLPQFYAFRADGSAVVSDALDPTQPPPTSP
jgi:hypothetical protein